MTATADYTPGTGAAVLLFKHGLRFDAVVRGLTDELEFSPGEATSAVTAALVELLDGPLALSSSR